MNINLNTYENTPEDMTRLRSDLEKLTTPRLLALFKKFRVHEFGRWEDEESNLECAMSEIFRDILSTREHVTDTSKVKKRVQKKGNSRKLKFKLKAAKHRRNSWMWFHPDKDHEQRMIEQDHKKRFGR